MLTTGTPAPDLALQDTDGRPLQLSDLRGRPVLLYFMRSTSCPVCNHHVKDLVTRSRDWAASDVTVLVVVPEGHDAAVAWRAKRGLELRVVTGRDGSPHASVGLTKQVFGAMQQSGSVLSTATASCATPSARPCRRVATTGRVSPWPRRGWRWGGGDPSTPSSHRPPRQPSHPYPLR